MTDLRKTYKTLEAMQKAGMLLLVHGEVTSSDIDLFDREAVFIEQQLIPLRRDFPELKIVFEHITTKDAADYVAEADRFTAATITAHHLLYNRNAIFVGGVRPTTTACPCSSAKRTAWPGAGCHQRQQQVLPGHRQCTAPCTSQGTRHRLRRLLHRARRHGDVCRAFDNAGALDKLEGFASFHGPDFYNLPRNTGTITLRRESWTPPESFVFGEANLKPLRAGEALPWRLVRAHRLGCTLAAALADPGEPWRRRCRRPVCQACRAFSRPAPVRFVPQSDLPEGRPTNNSSGTPAAPTRDNLHDFSTAWCGWNFRRPSGASTNCRPRPLRKTA